MTTTPKPHPDTKLTTTRTTRTHALDTVVPTAPSEPPRRSRGAWAGAILGLLGLAGLSGCGQTNYFDVTVTVKQDPMIGLDKLLRIDSCIVSVSGAATDSFPINTCSQGGVLGYNLGTLQYGTDKDSGSFTFSVLIRDGVQTTLGTGSAAGQVKSGTRTTLTVEVPLDPNAFK